jgi:excinuclease UvrABC helicase subunit UvrB
MFSFVSKHSPDEELAWTVEQFRPYVLMMNTRAKANLALEKEDVEAAVGLVQKGITAIEKFLRDAGRDEADGDNAEVAGLKEWLKELRKAAPSPAPKPPKPLSLLEQMHRDMEKAVRAEQYERAAELRDAIRALQEKG